MKKTAFFHEQLISISDVSKKVMILALLSVMSMQAQKEVTFSENLKADQDLYLNFKFAQDIKIEHGSTNELIVRASVNIEDGDGDDAFSIKTDNSSERLKVYSDFGDYFKNRWNDKSRRNCNTNTEINYVVIVPKGINLKVKSISGSLYIDTFNGDLVTDLISGDVTIKKYNGELRLKTISGALDVTVNKADLNAKSLTGTIYSDIDFEKDHSKKHYNGSHNKVSKQINGGSQPLNMETISGNIYIRKG